MSNITYDDKSQSSLYDPAKWNAQDANEVKVAVNSKVDKVTNKQLSTEDYSTAEKNKLSGVAAGATANDTDANLKNRANHTGVQAISTITNLQAFLDAKQDLLVSGTNIKTINGITILGAGDMVIDGGVSSVNGETGIVVITKAMIGLGNVDNVSDVNKPVSTATQTALNLKANIASPTFTGTVSGITKAMVGLSSVDNTSDTAKPISNLTQTALDLKAPLLSPALTGTPTAPTATSGTDTTQIATTAFVAAAVSSGTIADATTTIKGKIKLAGDLAGTADVPTVPALTSKAPINSPTFTGTVSGITKAMIGLPNADDTSDLAKPISTATQTALNAKQATLVSATNIKTVNGSSILGSGDLVISTITDGDKGDVTVASTGTVWTVPDLATKATPADINTALDNSKIYFDDSTFEGAVYPVPSGGEPAVGTEDNPIKAKNAGGIVIATVVESGNTNAVSSNAVFNAIDTLKGGETRTIKQVYDELYALIASGLTTPLAPTSFVVDDDDNTGAFTNAGGKTDADTEVTFDGGATQDDNTDNPFDVPDLDFAPGQVGVRYKAVVGVSNPSGWLFNSEPYTASGASLPINVWRLGWDAEQSLVSPNTILLTIPDTVGFGIGYADLKVLETGIAILEAQGDNTTNGIGQIYFDDDNDDVNNPSLPLYSIGFADSVETGRKVITKDTVVYNVDPGVDANLVKIRIRTDSTNIYYEYSIDGGSNWVTLDTVARTGIQLYAKVAVENSFGIRNCNNIKQSGLISV